MKRVKKIIFFSFIGLLSIWLNYAYVSNITNSLIINKETIKAKFNYALFLGTHKYLPSGNVNNYYKNRIATIIDLYNSNKIEKIIISADSLNKYEEHEVTLIKLDLIQKGVKESDLFYDNKGNRTIFSISNLTQEMTLDTVVIISQKFHLQRAIYIAKQKGIPVIGIEAKGEMSCKLFIRELLARIKMQLDLL